jgi:hemoglobin-like flavoprotein
METNEVVTASFQKIIKNKDVFIDFFYDHLFQLAPEVKPLFHGVDKRKQGEKLYKSLVILVENINSPNELMKVLKPLGDQHTGYGTQLRHYPLVGNCLIDSLKHTIGEDWNKEMEDAWSKTYETVVMLMIS